MKVDLSDPVIMALTNARVKLLFDQPFFGQLAMELDICDASSWCNTAATDGRKFYYNRDFIKSLSAEELKFLFGHEILHCIYDHMGRRGARDPKIFNMANDYIVNYTLVTEKVGKMPKEGLYDPAYTDEMISEEVYDLIIKNSTVIKMTLDEHIEMRGPDDGSGDDGDQDGEGKSPGSGDGDEEGEGNGKGKGGSGKGTEVKVRVLGGKDGPPKLSQQDIEQMRNKMRAALVRTVQGLGAGSVPAGIRRLVDDLIEPKMDWRSLLDAHIRSSIKDDFTFTRLSRRTWGLRQMGKRLILPGQDFQDTIDISICVDASGSLSGEMLRDFLSEVKGIMECFRDFRIKLWSFDTQIYNFVEITGENIGEFDTWAPGGGGGTMFEANWEFMKREGIEPTRLIMFTDGYPNSTWGDPNYCDTLFIIYGVGHAKNIRAPFGLTAIYEPND